ncbi:hypothetical protein [Bradyrhizobium sp. 145]|uniref:hypothetical protein n=1 Tax=Bradyrhizobium sp. 145 TaxID=2782621 RepID=UPI001FFB582A|nr:hypothetical protein [Bradyrhizobium sp. 145]MCK1690214.1 hypothetical protein [Bradyrhizobium sp. 145]
MFRAGLKRNLLHLKSLYTAFHYREIHNRVSACQFSITPVETTGIADHDEDLPAEVEKGQEGTLAGVARTASVPEGCDLTQN